MTGSRQRRFRVVCPLHGLAYIVCRDAGGFKSTQGCPLCAGPAREAVRAAKRDKSKHSRKTTRLLAQAIRQENRELEMLILQLWRDIAQLRSTMQDSNWIAKGWPTYPSSPD
jgi:hypothetical protein